MRQLGILFPGQGSQSVGMLNFFADNALVRETFDEATAVLGFDVFQTCTTDPDGTLDQTAITQPCLLTASVALWRASIADKRFALSEVAYLAGHSLGEYSALVCAEALTFAQALELVSVRGSLMQSAVTSEAGAMSAILGLSVETVVSLCREINGVVQAANFNSPLQTVIAGEREAVLAANALAKEKGAKLVKLLPVSVPSHCDLMSNIVTAFQTHLRAIHWKKPKLPVLNNVDVICYADETSLISGLSRQLTGAVRWCESIEWMISRGVTHFYECGPGSVLTGLNKRISKATPIEPLSEGGSNAN